MKLTSLVAAGLALLTLFGSPSEAAPVPDGATGIWSVADCDGDGVAVLVNRRAALTIESDGGKSRVAVAKAEWVGGSLVLTIEGEEAEWVLPPLDRLRRCDALPGSFSVLFAEAVAVFRRLDEIDELCGGEEGITAQCVAVAFDIIDVSGDGIFSRAELSRAIRAASFFVGHRLFFAARRSAFVPMEDLYITQLAASALGPFVAVNLIDSYDYDGDGFLSPKELLQDRKPEEGLQGAIASLAGEAPPALLSALLKSATDMFQLLR